MQIPVQAQETACNKEWPEDGNREISKENETLHSGATPQSGEDRIRITNEIAGKLALRHHARREIRRAPTVENLI